MTACAATANLAAKYLNPQLTATHTMPLALMTFTTGLTNVILPLLFRRLGRWPTYVLATAMGLAGSFLCLIAIQLASSLALLLLGMVGIGFGLSAGNNYRFAVLLLGVPKEEHAVASSWVIAGGVLGAALGPEYAKHLQLVLSQPYAGVFIGGAVAYALHMFLLFVGKRMLHFSDGKARSSDEPAAESSVEAPAPALPALPRPLSAILAQPRCFAAVSVAAICYAMMVSLMAALPLSMADPKPAWFLDQPTDIAAIAATGFSFGETSTVIQAHMICMFAPSFVTGHVIRCLGARVVQAIGACIYVGACLAMLLSIEYVGYMLGQSLLGLGWNFCFVASSASLVLRSEPGQELTKLQALNDLCVFGLSGLVSLLSSPALRALGWGGMQLLGFGTAAAILCIVAATEVAATRETGMSEGTAAK